MKELIARLEAAEQGSRELDAEIACALRWPPKSAPQWIVNWDGPYVPINPGRIAVEHPNGKTGVNWSVPKFTGSIDAALTLVKPGKHSNLAAFLNACFFQLAIGDISDERLALRVCIRALQEAA